MSIKEVINNYSLSDYLEYVKVNNIGSENVNIPFAIFLKLANVVIEAEPNIKTVSEDYNILTTDKIIIVDSETDITLVLPDATLLENKIFTIRNNSDSKIILKPTNYQEINDPTLELYLNYKTRIQNDNAQLYKTKSCSIDKIKSLLHFLIDLTITINPLQTITLISNKTKYNTL